MEEIELLKAQISRLEADLSSEQARISNVLEYIVLYLDGHPQPPLSHQEKAILEMIQSYLND